MDDIEAHARKCAHAAFDEQNKFWGGARSTITLSQSELSALFKSVIKSAAPDSRLRAGADGWHAGRQAGIKEARQAAWQAWTMCTDVGETGDKIYSAIQALAAAPAHGEAEG